MYFDRRFIKFAVVAYAYSIVLMNQVVREEDEKKVLSQREKLRLRREKEEELERGR